MLGFKLQLTCQPSLKLLFPLSVCTMDRAQAFSSWARRDSWRAELKAMPPHQIRALYSDLLDR